MEKARIPWWQSVNKDSLWYLIGLITSDGCLSSDRRHIDITAKERSFLEVIVQKYGLSCTIAKKHNGRGQISHHIQISSKSFYDLLTNIGLMPAKSKKLGALDVPNEFFSDFLRGVIDGDGCIRRWIHPTNGREQWSLRIVGASKPFIDWLEQTILKLVLVKGKIYEEWTGPFQRWVLKFGKLAAQKICRECYGKADAPTLERKAFLARQCSETKRGWTKSRTVLSEV